MTDELKLCPFCNGICKIKIHAHTTEFSGDLYRPFCTNCHAILPWTQTEKEARDEWNRRA